MSYTLEYYIRAALQNERVLSRTTRTGEIDRSASGEKPQALGTALKEIAEENYVAALSYLYLKKDNSLTAANISELIKDIFCTLNRGLIHTNKMLRTHEIQKEKKYGYPAKELPEVYDAFCKWYEREFSRESRKDELYAECAITEIVVDKVHLFSDSCGRMSRLLASFFCMKQCAPLKYHEKGPTYNYLMMPLPDRTHLFSKEGARIRIEYYNTLKEI